MCRCAVCFTGVLTLLILLHGCSRHSSELLPVLPTEIDSAVSVLPIKTIPKSNYVTVKRKVAMKDYFFFIDSLANANADSASFLNEYILVNANPWIIDSLRGLDYYSQKAKGIFIYDQTKQIILHPGDSLMIPDSTTATSIMDKLKSTRIDINIPEFKLRIIQNNDTVMTCPVRVGRNADKYLEYYQREIDLRTPIGEGKIVTVRRKPKYIDLQTGKEYIETNRDDDRRTKMPIIPSLEPSINGKFVGTLIHATTNPKSLGKAYSHGCIGTSEPDIWSIYYYSPPGTKVSFRYDLQTKDAQGNEKKLRDIYHRAE